MLATITAKSSRRYTRKTAERVLSDLMSRVQMINAPDTPYAFRVDTIRLFGSMLTTSTTVGDIDLAIKLVPRHEDRDHQKKLSNSRKAGRRFSSIINEAIWPYEEVLRALKCRSSLISLHRWEEPDELGAVSKIIWKQDRLQDGQELLEHFGS